MYCFNPSSRGTIRLCLGSSLVELAARFNSKADICGTTITDHIWLRHYYEAPHNTSLTAQKSGMLNMLGDIMVSMQAPSPGVCLQLVHQVLVPLHRQNGAIVVTYKSKFCMRMSFCMIITSTGMTLWRDQHPILKVYHNELVAVVVRLIEKGPPNLVCVVIRELLKEWPEKFNANTPKEILLLVRPVRSLYTHYRHLI